MIANIVIPKGFRNLRRNENPRKGDYVFDCTSYNFNHKGTNTLYWVPVGFDYDEFDDCEGIFIRRIK